MGIWALLITVVLKAFRVCRVYWVLFLGPLLIAYTLATGARASAVRACIMAIIYFLAPLLGRKADVFSTLALAALIILVAVPAQLFDVGFIFSFVVVTGIIVLYPIFESMSPLEKLARQDRFIPRGIEMDGRDLDELTWRERIGVFFRTKVIKHVWRPFLKYVSSLVSVSCSAWLVSAPLTAYFFGRFAPVALLGNLIVIPLAFLIILTGCLSIVLGSCIALFADIFNHANLALVSILVWATKFMASVPFGSIQVSNQPLWLILTWYVLLAGAALLLRSRIVSHRQGDQSW